MKISYILQKDVKRILYDKKLLIIILIMPIVLMTILGFSLNSMFGVKDSSVSGIEVVVVKNYMKEVDVLRLESAMKSGILSRGMDDKTKELLLEVTNEFDPEDIFFQFLEGDSIKDMMTYKIEDEDTARQMLKNKEVDAVVILPDGYVYNSYVNFLTPYRGIVEAQVLKRTSNQLKGGIVEALIDGFVQSMNNNALNKEIAADALMAYAKEDKVFEVAADIAKKTMMTVKDGGMDIQQVGIEEKKQLTSFQYYAAAIMAMFILYSAGYGGRQILAEKKEITLQRNQVAGVSFRKILISTFLMICIISIIQSVVMITYSRLVLKIYWGNWGLVALTILISSLTVASIGILVAALTYRSDNFRIANIFESGIIQVMALLGGSFVPVEVLPGFMQNLSYLAINGVAIKMYTGIMEGASLGELSQYITILGAMSLVFILVATVILKNRREAI